MKKNKILVPVSIDQRENAEYAVAEALSMRSEEGEIIIINAREPLPGSVIHYLPENALQNRTNEIMDYLQELAGSDTRIRTELVSGRPGTAIIEYAEKHAIDCIVIASHHPGLKDYFLGSTSERVVRHSPCSVYVLR